MGDIPETGMTEKDILLLAIEMERKAIKVFSATSGIARDPQTKRMLEELTEEEFRHKKMLFKLMDKVDANRPLPKPDMPPEPYRDEPSPDITLDEDSTMEQAIRYAMHREKVTLKIYQAFAELLADGPLKELFEFLTGEERKHFAKFESML